MAKPNTNYLLIAKGLLRYLKGIAIARITYKLTQLGDDYIVQSDAIWGIKDDRKSFQGYVLVQHKGLISQTANRQKSITQSTIEAEICASSEGARQVAWFEKLVKDLDKRTNTPILIIDNATAKELAKT